MKYIKWGLGGGAIALGIVGGVMVATNPSPERYQTYATAKLVTYLEDSFCSDLPNLFGQDLQERCTDLVDENRPRLGKLVATNTQRQNFGIFSIYHTDLRPEEILPEEVQSFVPAGLLPNYQVQTIGAFQQFWVYQAQKK